MKPSPVRLFALVGGTHRHRPATCFRRSPRSTGAWYAGNKPLVGIPPYTVIAFELTVLFGALAAFLGFLADVADAGCSHHHHRDEFGDQFEIYVEEGLRMGIRLTAGGSLRIVIAAVAGLVAAERLLEPGVWRVAHHHHDGVPVVSAKAPPLAGGGRRDSPTGTGTSSCSRACPRCTW